MKTKASRLLKDFKLSFKANQTPWEMRTINWESHQISTDLFQRIYVFRTINVRLHLNRPSEPNQKILNSNSQRKFLVNDGWRKVQI